MLRKGILSFLSGLLFLYIQVLFVPALTIAEITPLILLPWLIHTVWKHPQEISLPIVFLIGLLYDTQQPTTFGMHALFFCLLALLINVLRIPFEHDSIIAKLIAIASSNLAFSILIFFANVLRWGFDSRLYLMTVSAFLYNFIFSTIVFGILQVVSHLRITLVDD
nr:rod shape-determining protein MreD [Candidatus Cloacimonadota bacterium]